MAASTSAPPADYGELFEQYFDRVKGMCRRSGIFDDEVEDVASEILLRFVERGYFAGFKSNAWYCICPDVNGGKAHDPAEHPEGAPIMKQSSFWGALHQYVALSLRNALDKQGARIRRERLMCDVPTWTGDSEAAIWVEVYGPVYGPDSFPETSDLIRRMHTYLSSVSAQRREDLAGLFRIVVGAALEGRTLYRKDAAKLLGQSEVWITQAMKDLRYALWEYGFSPGDDLAYA